MRFWQRHYAQQFKYIVEIYFKDEDELFLRFIKGLADVHAQYAFAKSQVISDEGEVKIDNNFLYEVSAIVGEYILEFLQQNPSFDTPLNGRKLAKFQRAIIHEYYADEKMPATKRLQILESSQTALSDYWSIEMGSIPFGIAEQFDFMQAKIDSLGRNAEQIASEPDLMFWEFGFQNLRLLEQKLKGLPAPLLEINSNLIPLFSNHIVNDAQKANWKGDQVALIYMLYKIAGTKMKINNQSIYEFVSGRFTVKGKTVTAKNLSSSLNMLINDFLLKKNRADILPPSIITIDQILAYLDIK